MKPDEVFLKFVIKTLYVNFVISVLSRLHTCISINMNIMNFLLKY